MKKISILLLMFVLLFTSTVAAHASTEAMALEVIDLKGYTVNVLEKNNVYEKLQAINKKTGEVEYVESFLDGDHPRYVVTTEENEFIVIRTETEILIYQDNEMLYREDLAQFMNNKGVSNEVTPLDDYGPWTGWSYIHTSFHDIVDSVFLLAAMIAACIPGGATASDVIDLAGDIITMAIENFWLKISLRQRYDFSSGYGQQENLAEAYRYSSYTGLIGSVNFYTYVIID